MILCEMCDRIITKKKLFGLSFLSSVEKVGLFDKHDESYNIIYPIDLNIFNAGGCE